MQGNTCAVKAQLKRCHNSGTPPLFNTQFIVGENELILIGLRPVLGLGLLSFRPPGLN